MAGPHGRARGAGVGAPWQPPQDVSRHREVQRRKIPLLLAWDLTVHKTQGLSMAQRKAVLDLGHAVLEDGH